MKIIATLLAITTLWAATPAERTVARGEEVDNTVVAALFVGTFASLLYTAHEDEPDSN
jgi:hypothetical protein